MQSCADSCRSLATCGIYYVLWIYILPKFRGYRIRQQAFTLDKGAVSHELVRVPVNNLAEWDATHDAVAHRIGKRTRNEGYVEENVYGDVKPADVDLNA